MSRYRIELRTKALLSEDAYQRAVERLADVKRRESLCLLKDATVQEFKSLFLFFFSFLIILLHIVNYTIELLSKVANDLFGNPSI